MQYKLIQERKKMVWSRIVPAWTQANIVAPATEPRGCTTHDGAGGEVELNPRIAPPSDCTHYDQK